jgi:WD40 repeat protein
MEVARSMMTLTGHTGPVWCLVQLNETLIASGSEDCTIKVKIRSNLKSILN